MTLIIRDSQMAVLGRANDVETEDRAVGHLQHCIPGVCASLGEPALREVIRWGRKRARRYEIENEADFFRYLNLMFMFGFEFDTNPEYPWASRSLTAPGRSPSARMNLLVDYAMLFCSQNSEERSE